MRIREAQALARKAINVRGLHASGPVATHIAVAEIISVDEQNIRRTLPRAAGQRATNSTRKQEQFQRDFDAENFHGIAPMRDWLGLGP
jgi:hypothetical protein